MAYSKTAWANSPATTSPINQTNLNKMEDGIFDNDVAITNLKTGWNALTGTFTYSSADAPTFVMNTPTNLTGTLSVGMKIRLSQTTAKYFFITAITSSTITMYGGTDYTLVNAAISNVFYSTEKAPYGFPLDPLKWSVTVVDNSVRTQLNPVNGTVYNLGSRQISVPIGSWNVNFQSDVYTNGNARASIMQVGLSTANNSFSTANLYGRAILQTSAATLMGYNIVVNAVLNLMSKTTYFANYSTDGTATELSSNGTVSFIIRATCAYL